MCSINKFRQSYARNPRTHQQRLNSSVRYSIRGWAQTPKTVWSSGGGNRSQERAYVREKQIDRDHGSTHPYNMEGFINGYEFKTIIDSGLPLIMLALNQAIQNLRRKDGQVRIMIEYGKNIDNNAKPLTGLCLTG